MKSPGLTVAINSLYRVPPFLKRNYVQNACCSFLSSHPTRSYSVDQVESACLDDNSAPGLSEQEMVKEGTSTGPYVAEKLVPRTNMKTIRVPDRLRRAALTVITQGHNLRLLAASAEEMRNYLWNRRLPVSRSDLAERVSEEVRNRQERKSREEGDKGEEIKADIERERRLALVKLRRRVYNWKPMRYGSRDSCLAYLMARTDEDYAATVRVLTEIKRRDSAFAPRHVIDFGSGIGGTLWACESVWSGSVGEYYLVDPSREMNDLALLLLRDGNPSKDLMHSGVYFRQFLPTSVDRQYDMVVCAFSLLELPSYEERVKVVETLWKKTMRYLAIIDIGTFAGFQAVLQARDYIISAGSELDRSLSKDLLRDANLRHMLKKDLSESEKFNVLAEKVSSSELPTLLPSGHVFAPCPHNLGCPRLAQNKVTPCKFSTRFVPLNLANKRGLGVERAEFCYVILRKGGRDVDDEPRCARIVKDVAVRKRHVWCQMCTPDGALTDVCIGKRKHGRWMHDYVRSSNCGDLLSFPIQTD